MGKSRKHRAPPPGAGKFRAWHRSHSQSLVGFPSTTHWSKGDNGTMLPHGIIIMPVLEFTWRRALQ
jgi:hypothetical protein